MDASSLGAAFDWTILPSGDIFYLCGGSDSDAYLLPSSEEEFEPWISFLDTPNSDEVHGSAGSTHSQNDAPVSGETSDRAEISDWSYSDDIFLTPISPSEAIEEMAEIVPSTFTSTAKDLPCTPEQSDNETNRVHPNKRKWEESLFIFPSDPNGAMRVRKRNSFNDARRRDVAFNRRIGACVQCKLRKGCCNFGIPCDACTKRARSNVLAQELCTRQGLVAARFNNVDLLCITRFKNILGKPRRPLAKTSPREVHLFWPNCCSEDSSNRAIKLSIQDFAENLDSHGVNETIQTLLIRGYTDCQVTTIPDMACAIVSENLPSLDELLDSLIDSDHSCNSGPFIGLHKTFGKFGEHYCWKGPNLPLQHLLRKVVRMKRLLSLFRKAARVKLTPEGTESEFTGFWMNVQLKHHIATGIMELEADIFDDLDKLLYCPDGIGRRNPLATWVCLWILLLAYKEQMAYIYFHYRNEPAQQRSLYGCAKHIYNTLTAIYAALYRTTSPLTLDWRKEEVWSEMLGRDPELIRLFCDVKTEMYWFHSERDQLFPEDELFKTLVVENESKLMESHKKIAKKQGIL